MQLFSRWESASERRSGEFPPPQDSRSILTLGVIGMLQSAWEETVTKAQSELPEPGGQGHLLQIHPLEVSARLIDLQQPQTTVGRDASCGLNIADSSVSRRHALIERTGDEYHVTDLQSTNGTRVNELPVESATLKPGDRVQFGNYIFKFLSSNHIELHYHEAVYSMMTRDGLTGTLNKRSFLDIIHREFQKSLHRGTSLCLIMMDIDHFKSVNDTRGHLAGDEVLKELGNRVNSVIAEHDVFARYGGEEFAILLTDLVNSEAIEVAQRCRAAVEAEPFPTSVGPLPITISVGVAEFASLESPEHEDQLVQAADAKLYEAKHGGRNRVCS
ncbi:diguanylate cyclase [Novipirellula sp. SH528]|uniref:diguanylate cyclase n=1 Tax=Novipirellula sp. SH528 TaxID=3454466 RepID=UPI003F9EDB63